jgi:hypothetical protein
VIQRDSPRLIRTSVATFDVEGTIRGGHLVRVSSVEGTWVGLYDCGEQLILRARCHGTPPAQLTISTELRVLLADAIDSICRTTS